MIDPLVSVLRNRFVRSLPDKPGARVGERAYELPLSSAMRRPFSDDSHFVAYTSSASRRLSQQALATTQAVMSVVVLDVDCPETHGTSEPAPESWRQELREKLVWMSVAHGGPYYYGTRGGGRIVYRLPTPVTIATPGDARAWSQGYAVLVAYVARRFGIEADPACGDWQRLFRLPRATRVANGAPEAWETSGDAANVASLCYQPSAEDINVAMANSKAFHVGRIASFTPDTTSDGYGLLYHALRNRGHIIRQRPGAGYLVVCPRDAQHSSGKPGDSSTVLYLPAAGEQVGAIHCKHAHCVDLTPRDWVREFSLAELDAARADAGIADRRANP